MKATDYKEDVLNLQRVISEFKSKIESDFTNQAKLLSEQDCDVEDVMVNIDFIDVAQLITCLSTASLIIESLDEFTED